MDDDDGGLDLDVRDILKAFELAGPYATGKSNKAKLESRWQIAMCLVGRAQMETDRGLLLLELTNKVADLEAENAKLRKGSGGGITFIGPFEI